MAKDGGFKVIERGEDDYEVLRDGRHAWAGDMDDVLYYLRSQRVRGTVPLVSSGGRIEDLVV